MVASAPTKAQKTEAARDASACARLSPTGHDGFVARRRTTSTRTFGLAMVVLLAMTQVGAALHFALVRHAVSPVSGAIVHFGDPTAPASDHAPPTNDAHTACEVFAVLFQATTVNTPTPTVGVASLAARPWAPSPTAMNVVMPWPIFMLAPSHSPPVLAA
jgi:hypothetical protein